MAPLNRLLYLGVYLDLCVWICATAEYIAPRAENVQWMSLDFKTILTWTSKPSLHNYKYSVLYSRGEEDWLESPDCTLVSASECDLTTYLEPFDRTYTADIKTESLDGDFDPEELPHTYSTVFNPYKDSNISAVKFTVEALDDSRVMVNVTDTLTSIYRNGKQLSIRDVLRNELKYKIIYYKSGSTGKREIISDSSVAEVPDLDAGLSYCFMVAAFIPSRPKNKHGAWSKQQCTHNRKDPNVGALVGAVFCLLAVVIIIVTVVFLCCRRQKKNLHTSSSSQPV